MCLSSKSAVCITVLLLSCWITPAYSVAYCALRDPVNKIYSLFPDATTYRSIVHEIDETTQQQIKNRIPFSIHQDEFGQHTLYIAIKNQSPIGIIHSRSEVGLWGLVEIVWAFDLDLNVIDFMFQRCRENACKQLEKPDFRKLIQGKSVVELVAMLEKENVFYPAEIITDKETKTLFRTIIRSAIKTALVTQYSLPDQLSEQLKKIPE